MVFLKEVQHNDLFHTQQVPFMPTDTPIIWLDLEMTGLEVDHNRIIEIATVITDASLNTLAEGPVLAIHQSNDLLEKMDDWNTNQHGKSGLTQRVRESTTSEHEAEFLTLTFLQKHLKKGECPMGGNSLTTDRMFLKKYMPTLERFFHYRNIDVSTLKELTARWAPHLSAGVQKTGQHLALSDIYESIQELQYYREHLLKTFP